VRGDFHESLNLADRMGIARIVLYWRIMGMVFLTQQMKQYRCENLADKGIGYGMESHILDVTISGGFLQVG